MQLRAGGGDPREQTSNAGDFLSACSQGPLQDDRPELAKASPTRLGRHGSSHRRSSRSSRSGSNCSVPIQESYWISPLFTRKRSLSQPAQYSEEAQANPTLEGMLVLGSASGSRNSFIKHSIQTLNPKTPRTLKPYTLGSHRNQDSKPS